MLNRTASDEFDVRLSNGQPITAPAQLLDGGAYPTPSKVCKVFERNDLSWYFLVEKPKEGGRGEGLAHFSGLFPGARMSSAGQCGAGRWRGTGHLDARHNPAKQ